MGSAFRPRGQTAEISHLMAQSVSAKGRLAPREPTSKTTDATPTTILNARRASNSMAKGAVLRRLLISRLELFSTSLARIVSQSKGLRVLPEQSSTQSLRHSYRRLHRLRILSHRIGWEKVSTRAGRNQMRWLTIPAPGRQRKYGLEGADPVRPSGPG